MPIKSGIIVLIVGGKMMNFLDSSKTLDTLAKNGKYGVVALGMILIYKIVDKAIEKDYFISLDFKKQKLELTK